MRRNVFEGQAQSVLNASDIRDSASPPAMIPFPRNLRFITEVIGDYSAVATYGCNVARALGIQTTDGLGNLKPSAIVNQPGPGGTRMIVSITFTGSYIVNNDGTGTISLTINLPNGRTAAATEDF